ncbi:MAG TPA: 30S ribosomal protein S15 [Candidatus Aminicenantes bacterium]|nr:30S ribosomal protein S15 [Candidatus Aminicenantes bacterium]
MSITKETKQKLIGRFQINEKDTGSSEVQIAVLTERIRNLTEHFKTHQKDNHSRKGLLTLVSTRKKLLNYLRRTDYDKYVKVIQELELRK